MRNKTFAVTVTNWEALSTNLQVYQDELPDLQARRAALAAFVAEGRLSIAQQIQADGARRDIVARRFELNREGNHLQQFLEAALRQHYGPDSPRLVQFGVRPRNLRRLPSTNPDAPGGLPENPGPPPSDS
jgi:hypothetical protein